MTSSIHPVSLHFQLPINADLSVERLVHCYIVTGEQLCVVDTGVAGSYQTIVDALAELGRSPSEVEWVVNTHAHPDHAGGNRLFQERVDSQFACHVKAARWVENMALQAEERPVFGFDTLVAGSVEVTRQLQEGDELDLGGGTTLQVIFTPGHSPGSMSLFCPEDGTLLSGDAIPPTAGLPLYIDLDDARRSLRRLADLPDVRTLYHSHITRPFTGPEIPAALQDGLDFIDHMEESVAQAVQALPADATPEDITRETLLRMGMDPPPVMPITIDTIVAHLNWSAG